MRTLYIVFAVILIGATVFTFMIREENKSSAPVPQATGTLESPSPSGSGMNPAHGQPGHRCEIPVGAPLNSASQPEVNQAAPTQNQAGPRLNTTAKTNPAHGLPGHRCDLPVGAPL